jgi:hypothetical protein
MAALSDLKGALTAAAADETKMASAKAKSSAALVPAATGAAAAGAHPATLAAVGSGGSWALILAGLALGALAVWLFLSIRKHQDAAAALTKAAKGA